MKGNLLMLFCVLLAAQVYCKRKRYDGYKVIEVIPKDKIGVNVLRKFHQDQELDFWLESNGVGKSSHIMVPPSKFGKIALELMKSGIKYKIINYNVQENVDIEQERLAGKPRAFNIDDFNRYEDIMQWLNGLSCAGGLSCSLENVGSSTEGRELRLLKMSTGPGKQIVWIDSDIHAREWIAPATNLKIINHLSSNYGSDNAVTTLLDKYDFYFVPMMNPDGYIYSWDSERYWRKNRGNNPGSSCKGTDLNRNFDTGRWASDGTSDDPCTDTYGGSGAASEVETQAIQAQLSNYGGNMLAYISFHAFAYAWLHPYGHTVDGNCELPSNSAALNAAANAAADAAAAAGGGAWRAGTVCEVINYAASGGSMDYARGPASISFPFTPELRGQDFVIGAEEIEPSFQETWAAVQAAIRSIEGS